MGHPTADVSVRVAWRADAEAIAALQVTAWRSAYDAILPADLLDALPVEQFRDRWATSISTPKEALQRVLVALERASVRGFTTTAPSTDDDADPGRDGEIGEIVVDPAVRRQGHGSRLLHAAVDTMRSDRFIRATTWLAAGDDELRGFLVSQGWEADGAYRELDLEGDGTTTVKQVRLHTSLAD